MLDRQVTIEKKITSQDSTYGSEVVDAWQSITAPDGPLWANKRDALASRGEYVRQGAEIAIRRTTFTIRYRNDVDSSMRIVLHDGGTDTVYQIVGVPSEIGRREWLELATEQVSS